MAFDNVFQGPPEDTTAPGTPQSPSLGVDVVNNDLYISSGNGWEELGGGGGGGGNISGTLTPGFIPIATAAHTIGNATIDQDITLGGALTINGAGGNGVHITDTNAGGIVIAETGGGFSVTSDSALSLINNGSGGLNVQDTGGGINITENAAAGTIGIFNSGSGSTDIHDSGGGGIAITTEGGATGIGITNLNSGGTLITDSGGGGITINASSGGSVNVEATNGVILTAGEVALLGSGGVVTQSPFLVIQSSTGALYNAATNPLPDPTTVPPGAQAAVSDATLPTYMGAYVGGGAVVCSVISDGATNWFTH